MEPMIQKIMPSEIIQIKSPSMIAPPSTALGIAMSMARNIPNIMKNQIMSCHLGLGCKQFCKTLKQAVKVTNLPTPLRVELVNILITMMNVAVDVTDLIVVPVLETLELVQHTIAFGLRLNIAPVREVKACALEINVSDDVF